MPTVIVGLLLTVGTQLSGQDRRVAFDGEQYHLAFVDVANGNVTNEYLKQDETLDSWTTLLAVRLWPQAKAANETAQAWLRSVQPLLSRQARLYERQNAAGGADVIVEAWLSAPDKSYIEANLHRFVADEHGGVKAYQFAQRMVMTKGRSDPSTFLKRRRDRFEELGNLVIEVERARQRSK